MARRSGETRSSDWRSSQRCGTRRAHRHIVDDDVNVAVVEEVSEGHTTRGGELGKTCPLDCGDKGQLACVAMEEQSALFPGCAPVLRVDLRIDVAVDHEEIEPAIVVVVEEGCTPAKKGYGRFGDTLLIGGVGEVAFAIVAVKRVVVVREGCVVKVDATVVQEIAGRNAMETVSRPLSLSA